MEEIYNLNCSHKYFKDNSFLCMYCGSIFIDKNTYGIIQNKIKCPIEIDPNEIFIQMKRTDPHTNLKFTQVTNTDKNSNFLSKRKKIFKSIQQFISKFKFHDKTYHLTVFLFDYIISKLKNDKLLIHEDIAVGCLVVSIKFIESHNTMPDLTLFQYLFEYNYYKIEEIKKFETYCLKQINYNLSFATAYNILELFIRNGIIFSNDLIENGKSIQENLRNISRIFAFVYEILDFTIIDNNYRCFSSFEIACSCVYLAREIIKVNPWSKVFEIFYQCKFEEFRNCYDYIKSNYYVVRNSGNMISLYINDDDSPVKKSRNGAKDSGKDLKIFEAINFNLETYSTTARKLPGHRKTYSKSQEATFEDKNLTQFEQKSFKTQQRFFQINSISFGKQELKEFQTGITPVKINFKKLPENSSGISTMNPDNKLSTHENSPIRQSSSNISSNNSKFAIYKPGNKGFKTANTSSIRENSNDNITTNREQIKPYVKPQVITANKKLIKDTILQNEIHNILTEGNSVNNQFNPATTLNFRIKNQLENYKPSSSINRTNVLNIPINSNALKNYEPKISSKLINIKEKENINKGKRSSKKLVTNDNSKQNEYPKTINFKKNSFSASKAQNGDKLNNNKNIPQYREINSLFKIINYNKRKKITETAKVDFFKK